MVLTYSSTLLTSSKIVNPIRLVRMHNVRAKGSQLRQNCTTKVHGLPAKRMQPESLKAVPYLVSKRVRTLFRPLAEASLRIVLN